jgi:hypothetical protein
MDSGSIDPVFDEAEALAPNRIEAVLEKVQDRLDHNPNAMGVRRQTAEHPFGTIKCWMGATHFLTKKLPKVATEMALNVLAYNMKRVMAIVGVGGLLEAMRA